ncbi:hypothetical protein BCIN_06g06710 [Botrytis cinerea B05.10]|uniref:Uncharacterized protein n=1 Tax=Botryotinia fuckeliana (strain B05.10) TaxID=332648 RepID=A0A384JLM0_BOTFB|nr:hypothetical protein BCIN_06g06710 [Botrytis cinerea B05.10]ATZ51254.1 hypothetical protein BCIN_06g06710 [Botrytis cinerea B05.10]
MSLSINRVWAWTSAAQLLTKALPFPFSKDINRFITNLPLSEIYLAISVYNMADKEKSAPVTVCLLILNKAVELLTRNDLEKLFQQIPNFSLTNIINAFGTIACSSINAFGTIACSSINAFGTSVCNIINAFGTSVCSIINAFGSNAPEIIRAFIQPKVVKYLCITSVVQVALPVVGLALLSKFTNIEVNKILLTTVHHYCKPLKTLDSINDH